MTEPTKVSIPMYEGNILLGPEDDAYLAGTDVSVCEIACCRLEGMGFHAIAAKYNVHVSMVYCAMAYVSSTGKPAWPGQTYVA